MRTLRISSKHRIVVSLCVDGVMTVIREMTRSQAIAFVATQFIEYSEHHVVLAGRESLEIFEEACTQARLLGVSSQLN